MKHFLAVLFVAAATPAGASNVTIVPTFDGSITSLSDAAAIESTINTAIRAYEGLFSNPVTIDIDFTNMTSGLGENTSTIWESSYSSFYSAYTSNASSNYNPAATTALSSGVVTANGGNNPVTGSANIWMKQADYKALGFSCGGFCSSYDGTVMLNTSITTIGNGTTTGPYSLLATVEHEIDEVLGLGSALNSTFQSVGFAEDLFRYSSTAGVRSYTTNSSALAYFSINGTTQIAQFDNQNDGGDWGDWQSNPLPPGVNPQVQDAFATPGSTPTLGPSEIQALEAVGWDLATPEPPTFALVGAALVGIGYWRRRRSRLKA